jgi:hypothetical protein
MIFKKNLNNLRRFLFILAIITTPKSIHHGINYNYIILWNTGYSNFSTYVSRHNCLHLDPGGTLILPKKIIHKLCSLKLNSILILHSDRFHEKYISHLNKISEFYKTQIYSLTQRKTTAANQNINSVIKDENYYKNQIKLFQKTHGYYFFSLGQIEHYGHLTKQSMNKVFIQIPKTSSVKYLLLPNHGQPKYLTNQIISKFKRYKMLISGSQSRSYKNHPKTEAKFLTKKIPIVYKNIWGHLVFEKVH